MGDTFTDSMDARDVLYHLLALKAKDMRPRRAFTVGAQESIRPAAEMLTAVEVNPSAPVVDIPPLYEQEPFESALRHGQGKFAFTEDNEVLYFADTASSDGFVDLMELAAPRLMNTHSTVTRREIGANLVDIGQVAQLTVKFRALRQAEGNFVFRELLQKVCVLDDGISMVRVHTTNRQRAKKIPGACSGTGAEEHNSTGYKA